MEKARVYFIVLGGLLLLAILAGCTYNEYYYGVGSIADEKTAISEHYLSE